LAVLVHQEAHGGVHQVDSWRRRAATRTLRGRDTSHSSRSGTMAQFALKNLCSDNFFKLVQKSLRTVHGLGCTARSAWPAVHGLVYRFRLLVPSEG